MRRLEGGNCAMRSACVAAESAFVVLSDVFPFQWMLLSWDMELAGSTRLSDNIRRQGAPELTYPPSIDFFLRKLEAVIVSPRTLTSGDSFVLLAP